jgi:hypothetical protein
MVNGAHGSKQNVHASGRAARDAMKNVALLALTLLFCASAAGAQGTATGNLTCPNEIPTGVKIVRLPATDQAKITVSDFSLATTKDDAGYDLTMRIKNNTENWCVTSLALAYSFGDARGQEWVANEYPAVKRFTTKPHSPLPVKGEKFVSSSSPHSVGLNPRQDETRVLFDIYDYIQPRPTGTFDGFHVISGEIKFCMGYLLDKPK